MFGVDKGDDPGILPPPISYIKMKGIFSAFRVFLSDFNKNDEEKSYLIPPEAVRLCAE